jgi:prepilin-type processing-associated H-X9-DG protein
VMAKARKQAHLAQCISNMKQLGVAFGAYLNDYDGIYPWAWSTDYVIHNNMRPAISQTMEAYVTDQRVWECPSDTGEVFYRSAGHSLTYPTPPHHSEEMGMSSYLYWGLGLNDFWGRLAGYPTSRVRKPSVAVLLREVRPWHGIYDRREDGYYSKALYNVLYCDGHVGRRTLLECHADAQSGTKP